MKFDIRVMTLDDYEEVRALWEATPGVGLDETDSRQAIGAIWSEIPV